MDGRLRKGLDILNFTVKLRGSVVVRGVLTRGTGVTLRASVCRAGKRYGRAELICLIPGVVFLHLERLNKRGAH